MKSIQPNNEAELRHVLRHWWRRITPPEPRFAGNAWLIVRVVLRPRAGVGPKGWLLLAALLLLCSVQLLRAAEKLFDVSPRPELLTVEEKRWLEAHPGIRMAPSRHFEPVEFFNSAGHYWGITSEYFHLIERRVGYRFRIVSLTSEQWERPDPEGRGADVITASTMTPSRVQHWSYTKPYLSLPTYIIARRNAADNLTLARLAGTRVAAVQGSATEEYLRTQFPNIVVDAVPEAGPLLRKVSFGLVDACVMSLPVATEWMQREGLTNLKIAGEAGFTNHLSVSVRKDWPELKSILDKALATITREEREAIYERWVKFRVPPSNERLKWAALWFGASLLGILVAVMAWNRSLALKVRARTAALREELSRRIEADKALEASEEKFSKAFRSSPDAIFLTRVSDGRVIEANDSAARIFACSKEDLIGHRSVGEGWGYVCTEDRDRVIALIREQGGALRDHEFQMLRRNGDQFTALVSCDTIEVGGEKCFVGVLRDVTGQRRAQEALQKSESALGALMDALPTPAMLLEKDGTFAAANEALALRFRRRRQELIGQNAYAMLPPDLASSRRAAIERVFSSGQGIRFEDNNGDRHYINYLSPAPDANGAVTRVAAFALDITERQQAEEALRASEARLHAIVHHTPNVAVQGYNLEGRVRLWNDASTRMFGFDADTAMGKTLDQLIHTREEAEKFVDVLRGLAGTGKSIGPSEYRFHRRNGEEGWCLSTIFEIPGMGAESLFVCMDVDITARKQAEAALQESEERLRLALDAAHMGIFDWDMTSQRIVWSRWHEELWGFKPGEFPGTYEAFSQRVHPDDLPGINAEVTRCMAAHEPFVQEFRVLWPDGRVRWILGTGQFEFAADGQPRRMRGTVIEITDRKRAETERQQLLVQLLEAEDEERGRLARELHDTTAQHLAATKMNLTRLSDAAAVLPPPVPQLLADSLGLVSQALHEIRTLTYLLHPPLLEELGLAGAVRDYAAGFAQRSGLRASVDAEGFAGRLPPAMELALFRVVQESLGNVHRHSGSDCARIRLERDAEEVRLEIQDNGRGMPNGTQAGVGLAGMRERLRQLGGRLEIESDAEGTTVLASLPLNEVKNKKSAPSP